MLDPGDETELARRFLASADDSRARAPLNAALARIVADDPDLLRLLGHAPPTQRLPVLLFAAIHDLLLRDPGGAQLAEWYPNLVADPRSPDDPALAAVLRSFVADRRGEIVALVAGRRVQTNEVGRCALLLPAVGLVAAEVGPVALLDVGASAGLNLLLDHYSYRYDDGPTIGGPSPVELVCSTRGAGPVPTILPEIAARLGVDRDPVDVTDPDDARWLEACCWPDQADRFARLREAIAIAADHPPTVVTGDGAGDVERLVDDLVDHPGDRVGRIRPAGSVHPIVTTTWVLNYLDADGRVAFVSALDRVGARRDLSWVLAEAPALTPELPHGGPIDEQRTVLALVRWRGGRRTVTQLAVCHPHGYWIHWATPLPSTR